MRRYRVTYGGAEWDAELGDEISLDLTADEETEMVSRGRLELVPAQYRVVGGTEVHDTPHGGTFEAALTAGEEAALIVGGHIELVEVPDPDEATKADLLEQARELDIEGRSGMTKDELASAIADALTNSDEEV